MMQMIAQYTQNKVTNVTVIPIKLVVPKKYSKKEDPTADHSGQDSKKKAKNKWELRRLSFIAYGSPSA